MQPCYVLVAGASVDVSTLTTRIRPTRVDVAHSEFERGNGKPTTRLRSHLVGQTPCRTVKLYARVAIGSPERMVANYHPKHSATERIRKLASTYEIINSFNEWLKKTVR